MTNNNRRTESARNDAMTVFNLKGCPMTVAVAVYEAMGYDCGGASYADRIEIWMTGMTANLRAILRGAGFTAEKREYPFDARKRVWVWIRKA